MSDKRNLFKIIIEIKTQNLKIQIEPTYPQKPKNTFQTQFLVH